MNMLSTLAAEVAAELKTRAQTVAVSESSAGGLISAALLAIPGASAYYLGGGVIYTREARRILLDIPDEDVRHVVPLSEDYVTRCAVALRTKLGATWAVAEIGTTGPTGSRYGIPAGVCWLVVDGPVRRSRLIENAGAEREPNMWAYTQAALNLLHEAMLAQP
ncbi:MAG: CinA family protein [Gammaproteobacteria bacterium]|nr:CinA family protein [Gammaproteobacteria bacterium]